MPISFLVCLEPIPVRTSKIEKQNTNDAGEFFFLLSTALREIVEMIIFQFQTLFPMVYFFFFSAWAIIFLDFQLYQVNPSQTILNCNTCRLINNFYDLS